MSAGEAPIDPNKDLATTAEWRRLNVFLDTLAEHGRAARTVKAYEDDWRALASWYHGSFGRPFDLLQLVGMDTADYLAYLQRTHAPATAARRLVFLKRYVATANRLGQASAELRERVEGLRPPRMQRQAPRGLTPEEARAALRRVQQDGSERDRAIVFAFLHTGLRVSELAGLDRTDVQINERSGRLHVRSEIAKGGKERFVPVAREARLELERYLATRNDILPALFVGQRGQMTPDGIRDVVVRYAGVPPHRLRHTFAYDFLEENNNDLVALADILGHDDIKTTRGYARRRPEDLQEAVERVRYSPRAPRD